MEEQTEIKSNLQAELNLLNERVMRIKQEISKVIVGQETTVDLIAGGDFHWWAYPARRVFLVSPRHLRQR